MAPEAVATPETKVYPLAFVPVAEGVVLKSNPVMSGMPSLLPEGAAGMRTRKKPPLTAEAVVKVITCCGLAL